MGPKRRSEPWTSHNRVLNGGKKYNGRNPNFDTEETKLLISLWGDPKVQKTLITTHKKHPVIARLAEQLREYGYNRTAEEINTRIKNLKCFYNRIRKDMEVGILAEPTWKHYRAMERIMTRPIFSVRPDEIPKPSPRFKMTGLTDDLHGYRVGKENYNSRQEAPVDETEDDSFDGDDEDDELFAQEMFVAEMECDDEVYEPHDLDQVTQEEEKRNESVTPSPGVIELSDIKAEPIDEDEMRAENGLIVPKDEPIDVDEPDLLENNENGKRDTDEANEIFPKLSAYLQLASNNSTAAPTPKSNDKIITTIAGSTTTKTNEVNTSATSNAIKIAQPMVIAQQQAAQQGKISLVPTNILLKPPQPQIQIKPQTQHILYNPGLAGNAAIATSGAPGQMTNGMKVLLVNALSKSGGVGSVNTTNATQGKIVTTNAMKTNCITSTVPNLTDGRLKIGGPKIQKVTSASGAGFRSLLTQLISIQNQTLEVSRQRLDVERQRFDFEKTIAERILAAIPQFIASPMPQQQSQQPNDRDTPTMPLLTPKVEKED